MTNIKNKACKFSTIFKSCLILSLGTSLIGCGGSGASSSSGGGGGKVAALTYEANTPVPKEVVVNHKANLDFNVETKTAQKTLLGITNSANAKTSVTVKEVKLPADVKMIKDSCTGKTLSGVDAKCEISAQLKDSRTQSVNENINIQYTDNNKRHGQLNIPVNVEVITEAQEKNTLSVPNEPISIGNKHPIEIKITNNNTEALNNVRVYLPKDIIESIDPDSIKGGVYNNVDYSIAMQDNLEPSDSHIFSFALRKGETDQQLIALDQLLNKDHSVLKADAANAKTAQESLSVSTGTKQALIILNGVTATALTSALNNKDFAKKYPYLSSLLTHSTQDFSAYAGGVANGPSQEATDTKTTNSEILTGNAHIVGPSIYNTLSQEFPDVQKYVIASENNLVKIAQSSYKGAAGVSKENIYNFSQEKPDLKAATIIDDKVVKQAVQLLKNQKAEGTVLNTISLSSPEIAGGQFGFDSDQYNAVVDSTLARLNQILQNINLDQFSVIITTSHGGHDKSSGTQIPKDKDVVIFSHQAGQKIAKVVNAVQGVTSVEPTLLQRIEVGVPTTTKASVIGDAHLSNIPFLVKFDSKQGIGAAQRAESMANVDKKFAKTISAFAHSETNIYLFNHDGTYLLVSTVDGKIIKHNKISKDFPGITDKQASLISGVVYDESNNLFHIFLSDGTTLTFDNQAKKIKTDGRTGTTSKAWPGLTDEDAKKIIAVIEPVHNGYNFILSDGYTIEWLGDKTPTKKQETVKLYPGIEKYNQQIIGGSFASGKTIFVINEPNDLYDYA